MGDTRRSAARLAAATLVMGSAAACAYALGLPPAAPSGPSSAPAAARQERQAAPQEPPRPPIEALTNRDSMLALLPRDHAGNVDWIAALRNGTIRPRAAAPGRDSGRVEPFGYDFFLGTSGPFEAFFPHSSHTRWLACATCHPTVFRGRGDSISMAAINRGEACGRCHGKVAFSPATCERCHAALAMGPDRVTPTLRDEIVIARATDSTAAPARRSYAPASFSHAFHRIRYRCSACHMEVFPLRAGAGSMRMADMERGAGCGTCHNGTAAFALVRCERCHVGGGGKSPS